MTTCRRLLFLAFFSVLACLLLFAHTEADVWDTRARSPKVASYSNSSLPLRPDVVSKFLSKALDHMKCKTLQTRVQRLFRSISQVNDDNKELAGHVVKAFESLRYREIIHKGVHLPLTALTRAGRSSPVKPITLLVAERLSHGLVDRYEEANVGRLDSKTRFMELLDIMSIVDLILDDDCEDDDYDCNCDDEDDPFCEQDGWDPEKEDEDECDWSLWEILDIWDIIMQWPNCVDCRQVCCKSSCMIPESCQENTCKPLICPPCPTTTTPEPHPEPTTATIVTTTTEQPGPYYPSNGRKMSLVDNHLTHYQRALSYVLKERPQIKTLLKDILQTLAKLEPNLQQELQMGLGPHDLAGGHDQSDFVQTLNLLASALGSISFGQQAVDSGRKRNRKAVCGRASPKIFANSNLYPNRFGDNNCNCANTECPQLPDCSECPEPENCNQRICPPC